MASDAGSHDVILDVIGTIYDSALDANLWPLALERIAQHCGAACGSITAFSSATRELRILKQWGAKDEFVQLAQASAPINPVTTAIHYRAIEETFTSVDYMGLEPWLACRFYREIATPFGYFDCVMSSLAREHGLWAGLSFPFVERDQKKPLSMSKLLLPLLPHVRRAVKIGDLLDMRALNANTYSSVLNLMSVGVILVNRDGYIVHANHAGNQLLDDGRSIRRNGALISARDTKSTSQILKAIEQAATGPAISIPTGGIAVPIADHSDRELAAWVLPLDQGRREDLATTFSAEVAIFIKEFGVATAFPADLFIQRYNITPAECRVLMTLVQGNTVADTCDILGISEPTAKTHLSRLFAKTNTSGQADLMRLAVSALAPAAVPPLDGA